MLQRRVVPATWANRGMAVALDQVCFESSWPMQMFKDTQIRYIYASNVLAGFAAFHFPTSSVREIVRIGVKPKFRRLGIGRELIQYITREAALERNTHLTAYVDERNLTACRFFAGCGFQSRLVRSREDTVDSIHFRFAVK